MGNSKTKEKASENQQADPEGRSLLGPTSEWETKDPKNPEKIVDKLKLVDRNQIEEKNKRLKNEGPIVPSETPGYEIWCKRRQLDQRHIARESNAKVKVTSSFSIVLICISLLNLELLFEVRLSFRKI